MDTISGDLLYGYGGNYDANGVFVIGHEWKAKCSGLEGAGKPVISVITGEQYVKPGQRYIRVGSITNSARQSGMFFDSITAAAPRFVLYDGLNSSSLYGGTTITDPSLTISQIGKLGSVYNENLGGYLTSNGLVNGTPLVGIYTKSLFADISGTSKLLIKQDTNNYISFVSGTLSMAATTFNLVTTNLGIYSGANAMILLGHASVYASAKIGFKNDGSGKLANGNIYWDAAGAANFGNNITVAGNILMGAGAIKINNAGAGASGYVLDAAGFRGYDTTLGLVFELPTNGSAPTFSSGIIREVIFEIYTSGVIRTSATVGNGGAGSAGVLMNNTGIYACKANQLLANANVKILADGTFSFTGDTNNSISWNGATLAVKGSITLTNTISADSITDGSVNKAYSDTEKTKLGTVATNADVTLSAINGGLTITGGGINLSSGGAAIRSGQTAYNTGTGFWLGLVSTTPKFSIGNGSTKTFTYDGTNFELVGGTITGGTIQTAPSGQRIVLNGNTNKIDFIDESGMTSSLYGFGNRIYTGGNFWADGVITTASFIQFSQSSPIPAYWQIRLYEGDIGGLQIDATNFNVNGNILGSAGKFKVNTSGQITRVNNINAGTAGKVLRDDGTSFTPASLIAADLPAGAFGARSDSSRFVAITSGGAVTTELSKVALTLGSTTYNFLLAD